MSYLLTELLDEQNTWIWDALRQKFAVTYTLHDGHHLYYLQRDDTLELNIPQGRMSYALFTHELLRIYLQLCKQIHIADYLLQQFWNEPLLSWTFNDNLMEEVGRMLENVKISDLYPAAKYGLNAVDWEAQRTGMTHLHLDLIQRGFSARVPTLPALDLYIYWFFATSAVADKDGVQNEALRMMKVLRPDLFDILDSFWSQWARFDIDQYAPPDYSYQPFTKAFLHKIGLWGIRQVQIKNQHSLN